MKARVIIYGCIKLIATFMTVELAIQVRDSIYLLIIINNAKVK